MQTLAHREQRWFRRYRTPAVDPSVRLVCLPHAGGAASLFRDWPALLPSDVDLLAVRYPGRQDRLDEPFVTSMDALAGTITEALRPFLDAPVALFGHSMGASVAHEVALRLADAGAPPVRLLVSGRLPPHRLAHRAVAAGGDEAIVADVLRLDARSAEMLADSHLRDLILPAIRADYQLVDAYRPGRRPVLGVPVMAYLGADDPETSPDGMRAWAETTSAGFALREFPGGHFFVTSEAADLVDDIARQLTRSGVSTR